MQISGYSPFVTLQEKNMQFYITTIGHVKQQKVVHRPAGIEDWLILYTVKGRGTCFIDGNEWDLYNGSLLFLPPGTAHEYSVKGAEWETLYITFNGKGMNGFLDFGARVCTNISNTIHFGDRFNRISQYKENPRMYKEQSVELYSLLVSLNESMSNPTDKHKKRIHKLTAAMHELAENPNNDLSPILEQMGVTEEHFCRIFKQYTGYRPIEYANIVRIQKAKILLRNTDQSISAIAREIGFCNHSYFTAVFKKIMKKTPMEYRMDTLQL